MTADTVLGGARDSGRLRADGEPPQVPVQIGPFRVGDVIGRGGMGVVYRGMHEASGMEVALKTVRLPHPSLLAGMRREIYALSRIQHPGVVRIMAEGVADGRPWYAMELLSGRTLASVLGELWPPASTHERGSAPTQVANPQARRRAGSPSDAPLSPRSEPPAPTQLASGSGISGAGPSARPAPAERPRVAGGRLPEVLTLIRRLCVPLEFLHGEGIVHRDLTPGNIFIRGSGQPVIMDFGLVWRHGGAFGREVLEIGVTLAGTTGYMAPEQVRGELVDARTDLYGLGCLLYECMTGHLPFEGGTAMQIIERQLTQAPRPPSQLCDGVPPELDALVLRLLAKRPRDRIGHAADVAAALAALGAAGDPDGAPQIPARAYLYRPELGGRDEARARIEQRLARATAGEGGVIVLAGESGIGKTALAGEVARLARARGVRVVAGECLPLGAAAQPSAIRGGAFHPLAGFLQALADRCLEGGRELTDKLLGARGRVLRAFAPVLATLPGQDAHAEPTLATPQDQRRALLEAALDTLAAFAVDTPLLLVLDDLQWADELTLALLAALPDSWFLGRRILLVATCRAEEVPPEVAALRQRRLCDWIALGRLDAGTVAAQVQGMLALPDPPAGLVRFLAQQSEGNPFFVAEYLRMAVAEGALYRDAIGRWQVRSAHAGQLDGLPLPRSIAELVERRLVGLSPEAQGLLDVAAVIGRDVEVDLLTAVGHHEPELARAPLRELIQRHILDDAGDTVRFLHDKLRETAHAHLQPERRREVNRAVAVALEARAAYLPPSEAALNLYPRLAHHFTEADDPDKAIDYLEKAAEQALRASANREAARFLEGAITLDARRAQPSPVLRRARWERQLGDACMLLGRQDECEVHLERAVALLGWPAPRGKAQLIASVARQALRQTVHRLLPQRFVGAARADAERLLEGARAYDRLMQNRFFTGEALPIMDAALRALNLSELCGPSPELGLAYGNVHGVAYLIPARRLAETYARRAYDTLARAPDPVSETWVRNLHAIYLLGIGAWDQARATIERSAALAEPSGLRRRWEETRGVLGHLELFLADYQRAAAAFHQQLDSALGGDPTVESWARLGLAQTKLARGDIEAALAHVTAARALLSHRLGKTEESAIHGVLAHAHLLRGEHELARAAADHSAAVFKQSHPGAFWCIRPSASVAQVHLALAAAAGPARRGELLAAARESCAGARRSAKIFPIGGPGADLCEGRYHTLTGDAGRARRAFERSATEARRLGMAYDEALAELALGQRRARAMETLERLGATVELERARRGPT